MIELMNAGDGHIVNAEQQTTELCMPDKLARGRQVEDTREVFVLGGDF